MAASNKPKKSKGKDKRTVPTTRTHGHELTAEEVILPEYGDVENMSKQSVLALKIAFEDIGGKYLKGQAENKILREKLEMAFKAYDDKYKETEELKKELDLKEKESANKDTDGTSHQDTNEDTVPVSSRISEKEKEILAVEQSTDFNKSFKSISTQTDEEKTDELAIPSIDYKDLLKSCGLEIVVQNDKVILILTDRDDLRHWLENETGGKVSVPFEHTSVCERFVQTDDYTSERRDVPMVNQVEQEAIIIQLKSKIHDQANVINKYRQLVEHMMQNQPKAPIPIEESSKTAEKKIIHVFKKYHETVLIRSEVALRHIMSLKRELEFQQNYSNHLLQIVKGTKVSEQFLLSIPNVDQPKLQGQREIRKPPEGSSVESSIGAKPPNVGHLNDIPTSSLLSMPVQETEVQPHAKASDASTEEESSASVVTLSESRSSSSEKSGLPPPQGKGDLSASSSVVKETSPNPSKIRSSGSERVPVPLPRRMKDHTSSLQRAVTVRTADVKYNTEVTSQDDDIIVINEEDVAMGGTSGISIRAKECPVCFMPYSASSQEEFEAHVGGHFLD